VCARDPELRQVGNKGASKSQAAATGPEFPERALTEGWNDEIRHKVDIEVEYSAVADRGDKRGTNETEN
jgi:hypothetical protein